VKTTIIGNIDKRNEVKGDLSRRNSAATNHTPSGAAPVTGAAGHNTPKTPSLNTTRNQEKTI